MPTSSSGAIRSGRCSGSTIWKTFSPISNPSFARGGARDTPPPGCGRSRRRGRTGGLPLRAAALLSLIRPSRLSPLAAEPLDLDVTRARAGVPRRSLSSPRHGSRTPGRVPEHVPPGRRKSSLFARPVILPRRPGRHPDLKLRTFLQGTMTRSSRGIKEFVSIEGSPDPRLAARRARGDPGSSHRATRSRPITLGPPGSGGDRPLPGSLEATGTRPGNDSVRQTTEAPTTRISPTRPRQMAASLTRSRTSFKLTLRVHQDRRDRSGAIPHPKCGQKKPWPPPSCERPWSGMIPGQ